MTKQKIGLYFGSFNPIHNGHLAIANYILDEFALPQPTRTVDTLAYLHDKYPDKDFALIMGADNLLNFHKWKNYEHIINNHSIYVYPRPNVEKSRFENHKNVKIINAPLIEISSSFIRNAIKEKKDIRFFLHPKVWDCINEMNYYK